MLKTSLTTIKNGALAGIDAKYKVLYLYEILCG